MDDPENSLGAFLRARRERVDPSDYGIHSVGRRRVPGLRREELAFLAGVSAPYYARLEQGRDRAPSAAVLDAIARVLQLDAETVEHMHRLAEHRPRRAAAASVTYRERGHVAVRETVSPMVQRLVDDWDTHPAFVVGRHREVLAANPLATALDPGFAKGRNLVYDLFLDPRARTLYPDWQEIALRSVAGLRAAAGERPDDPAVNALVGELSATSEDFREMWARHDVHVKTTGRKRFEHPEVGSLHLDYQTFTVNGVDGQVLHVFSAEPGSPGADGLALLALSASTQTRPSDVKQ